MKSNPEQKSLLFLHSGKSGLSESWRTSVQCCIPGATLLRLKPLIEIVDGQLLASKKYRGSIEKFVDTYMEEYLAKHDVSRKCLYLMYSKGLSQVALDRMKENAIRFGFENYEYVMTGCVISCHSGPGAIGLAGCCE